MERIRKAPEVVKAEQAFLSCVLSKPALAHEFYSDVRAQEFYKEPHRFIWRAIEACIEGGHEPTYTSVLAKLDEHDAFGAVPVETVEALEAKFPDARSVRHHADVIREFYRRRKLQSTCDKVATQLEECKASYDDARRMIDDEMQDIVRASEGHTLGSVAEEVEADAHRMKDDDEKPHYATGIEVVDTVLGGGLHNNRFYLIAARPKHGKTSLAVAITCALIERHGFAVDFWYTDGHRKDIAVAILAYLTGYSNRQIRNGKLSEVQREKLSDAVLKVQGWDFEIHDKGSPDPNNIRINAKARSTSTERYMCVVDYLQNCDAGFSGRDRGRLNAEYASQVMSEIRSDYGCISLGLAQFNRGADGEQTPSYHHLKYSGQLEQDVNDLLVWHRPFFTRDDATEEDERFGILQHQLSKHQAAGGRHQMKVSAYLGVNKFKPYMGQKHQNDHRRETGYGAR